METLDRLKEHFDPALVSWRVGSTNKDKTKGLALAYIDARDVMNRLDAVLGPLGWQDRYEVHGSKTICYLSILGQGLFPDARDTAVGGWITKADAAGDSDVEAEKGAVSDAFKRAAVKWGIGRYLYDLDSPWVELENSRYIAKHEHPRLKFILQKNQVAGWLYEADSEPMLRAVWQDVVAGGMDCPEVRSMFADRKKALGL